MCKVPTLLFEIFILTKAASRSKSKFKIFYLSETPVVRH